MRRIRPRGVWRQTRATIAGGLRKRGVLLCNVVEIAHVAVGEWHRYLPRGRRRSPDVGTQVALHHLVELTTRFAGEVTPFPVAPDRALSLAFCCCSRCCAASRQSRKARLTEAEKV